MNNHQYYKIFTTSRKFYCKIFILEQNSRNNESFLPRKFARSYIATVATVDYDSLQKF